LINDIPGLENPTAEHIAIWIYRQLKPDLQELAYVELYETPRSGVRYSGELEN
jgi:6-pyruvoyltetrahydropterin/6-carboxytetrahydropterin synthase